MSGKEIVPFVDLENAMRSQKVEEFLINELRKGCLGNDLALE